MDQFSSKNGLREDVSLSDSSTLKESMISESTLINQSIILSGNVNNVQNEICDFSNHTIDEFNTNIDALVLNRKENFLENKNYVDSSTGKVNTVKNHCNPVHAFSKSPIKSDVNESKDLEVLERPEIEITSGEESNGKFRVKFHIKGFKKIHSARY